MKNANWLFFRPKQRYVRMSLAHVAWNTNKNVDALKQVRLVFGRHV